MSGLWQKLSGSDLPHNRQKCAIYSSKIFHMYIADERKTLRARPYVCSVLNKLFYGSAKYPLCVKIAENDGPMLYK